MSKSNKFLVIIFTFLFVVLVFEIYYLVFYKYTNSSLNTNMAQLSPTTKPSVIPSETPAYTSPKELSSGNEWLTQDDLDNYRKLIDDNMVTSSILETRYVGTIKDITFSTEKNAKGIEVNVFEFNLYSKNGSLKVPFKMGSIVLNKMEVVQMVNNKEIPINTTDLKNGDQINMIYAVNLFFSNTNPAFYVDRFKIIKL